MPPSDYAIEMDLMDRLIYPDVNCGLCGRGHRFNSDGNFVDVYEECAWVHSDKLGIDICPDCDIDGDM